MSPIIIGEKPARPLRPPHSLELGPANDQSVFLMAVDLENLDIWKAFGFVFQKSRQEQQIRKEADSYRLCTLNMHLLRNLHHPFLNVLI